MAYKHPSSDTYIPQFEAVIEKAEGNFVNAIEPVRKSFFKRFPTFSLLLTTTGVTATFLGIEQLLLQIDILRTQPAWMLLLGVGILAVMGTLYKRLS